MNKISNTTVNEKAKEYPASLVGYHEIAMPAVAAALRCEHMPAPDDERATKQGQESPWTGSQA